jgi:hypothetical protein
MKFWRRRFSATRHLSEPVALLIVQEQRPKGGQKKDDEYEHG